tara:strand:+ start:2199 stop:2387 length:189 start_codon:yes stop_codon:yes gene_type:complete
VKRAAFTLLASVIGFQLVLIAGVLAGCFAIHPTQSDRCDGSKASELLSLIVAQSFALYASEK